MSRGRGSADRLPSPNPSSSPHMGLYTPSLLSPRATHIACKGMPKKERRRRKNRSPFHCWRRRRQGQGGKRDASEEPTAPSPLRRTSEEALVKKFSFFSTCGVRGGENRADSATRDYCIVNVLSVESPPLGGVKIVLLGCTVNR